MVKWKEGFLCPGCGLSFCRDFFSKGELGA